MADADKKKEKSTSVEAKKLPPLDQVPDAPPPKNVEKVDEMPTLKRKPPRVDQDDPGGPPTHPWVLIPPGDEEICGMEPSLVFNDLELCTRACTEFGRQTDELNLRMEQIRATLKRLNGLSRLCSHHQVKLQGKEPTNPNDAIKAFQKRSTEQRTKRRENAVSFMKGHTSVKDVQKQLQVASPLDAAHQRRAGFGQKRPAPALLKK